MIRKNDEGNGESSAVGEFSHKEGSLADVDKGTGTNGSDKRIRWVSFPAARSLKKTVLATGVIIMACGVVFWWTKSAWWLIVSLVFLGGSLSSFFLPTGYLLTEDRVIKRILFYNVTRPWKDFRSYYVDHNGILLSPFSKPSFLDTYRGIYLRYEGNREEVTNFVQERMESFEVGH